MARRRVLVVEDDDELRNMFRTALSVAGFEVAEASNGLDALRRIDASPPDLVVLDLLMPLVSGYGVLYDLASQAHTRDLPVVVVTGASEQLDNVTARCILRKPITPEKLVETVRDCLGDL